MNKRITATLSAVLILLVAGYRGSGRYTPPTTVLVVALTVEGESGRDPVPVSNTPVSGA